MNSRAVAEAQLAERREPAREWRSSDGRRGGGWRDGWREGRKRGMKGAGGPAREERKSGCKASEP